MTEIGRVKTIDEAAIIISCMPAAACHSCGKGGCEAKARDLKAINPRSLDVKTGDYVEVYLPNSQAVRAGFLVFVFPLALFFAAYQAADPLFGTKTEAGSMLTGLAGLVLGLAAAYVSAKKYSKLPEITRVIQADDPELSTCHAAAEETGAAGSA